VHVFVHVRCLLDDRASACMHICARAYTRLYINVTCLHVYMYMPSVYVYTPQAASEVCKHMLKCLVRTLVHISIVSICTYVGEIPSTHKRLHTVYTWANILSKRERMSVYACVLF
jgi:hypothetical protein